MNVPPFNHSPVKPNVSTQRETDERLCARIKEVWKEQGYLITAEVLNVGETVSSKRNPIYGIRSNLVNGLPSGKPLLVRE